MAADDLVGGRYRLVRSLGSGGMGQVWLAEDELLGRTVAVKQLRLSFDADPTAAERMMREARVAARLHHPNAVAVFDLVVENDRPHLIMEYVDGESLSQRLRREGRLKPVAAAAVIAQVADAVDVAAGSGIVHRDIKPANIMLTRAGVAKLADFGIARGLSDASLTGTGELVGSLSFMAPEVARAGTASVASDVWSLGATLYACLEGRSPFDGGGEQLPATVLARLMSHAIPEPQHAGPLAGILAGMLTAEPADRPSPVEVARSLRSVAEQRDQAVAIDPEATNRNLALIDTSRLAAGPRPTPAPAPAPAATQDDATVATGKRPPAESDTATLKRRRRRIGLAFVAVVALGAGTAIAVAASQSPTSGHAADGRTQPSTTPPASVPSTSTSSTHSTAAAEPTWPHTVTATFEVGHGVEAVVASPDGAVLYATNYSAGTVSVIDTVTRQVHTIPVGRHPSDLVINSAGTRVYVANGGSDTISIIDTTRDSVVATVRDIPSPTGMAVSRDGTLLYVTGDSAITAVSASNGTKVVSVSTGRQNDGIVVSPDGSTVYAVNGGPTIQVMSTQSNSFSTGITVGGNLLGLAQSPDGLTLYAAESGVGSGRIAVIATATHQVSRRFGAVTGPVVDLPGAVDIAITPDGKYLYLAGYGSAVAIISASSGVVTNQALSGAHHVTAVCVAGGGQRAFVADLSAQRAWMLAP